MARPVGAAFPGTQSFAVRGGMAPAPRQPGHRRAPAGRSRQLPRAQWSRPNRDGPVSQERQRRGRTLAWVLLGPLPAAGAHRRAAQIEVGGHVGDEPASPAGDLGVAAQRAHGDSSTTGFHLPRLPVPGGASPAPTRPSGDGGMIPPSRARRLSPDRRTAGAARWRAPARAAGPAPSGPRLCGCRLAGPGPRGGPAARAAGQQYEHGDADDRRGGDDSGRDDESAT